MDNNDSFGVLIGDKRLPLFVRYRAARRSEEGPADENGRRHCEGRVAGVVQDAPLGSSGDTSSAVQGMIDTLYDQLSSKVPEWKPVHDYRLSPSNTSIGDDTLKKVLQTLNGLLSYKTISQTFMHANEPHRIPDPIGNDVMELAEVLCTICKARANTQSIMQENPIPLDHLGTERGENGPGIDLHIPSRDVDIATGYPQRMWQGYDVLEQYYQWMKTFSIGSSLPMEVVAPENSGDETSTVNPYIGDEVTLQSCSSDLLTGRGRFSDSCPSVFGNPRLGDLRPIHPFLDPAKPEYGQPLPANIHSMFSLERIYFVHYPCSAIGFPPSIKNAVARLLGVAPRQIKAYTRPGGIAVTLDVMTSSGGFDSQTLVKLGDFWMEFSLSEGIMLQFSRSLLFTFAEKTIHPDLYGHVDEVSDAIHRYKMSNSLIKVSPICILEDQISTLCLQGEQVHHKSCIPVCRQDEKLVPLTHIGTSLRNGEQEEKLMTVCAKTGCLEVELEILYLLSPAIPVLVLPNDAWGAHIAAEMNACDIPTCYLYNLLRQSGHVISCAISEAPGTDLTCGGIFSIPDLIAEARAYDLDGLACYLDFLVNAH